MKKIAEVRDLIAGEYVSPCESVSLVVNKTDDGVGIQLIDTDARLSYSFVVNERASVVDFEVIDIPTAVQGE